MPKKWWALAAVACGTFMATLDSSIVNIALPTFTKQLASDLSLSKWVIVIYLLVISCLLLPFGKISDLYGRRKIFSIGLGVFTMGSLFCAFSPTLHWLIFSRVVQGIGASMLMSNGPAIITAAFPLHELGKALGTMAMVVSAGLVSGPSLGGFLISNFGWPSIFLINLPIGIFGIVLALRFVSRDRSPGGISWARFDWAGAFLQTVIIVLLMFVFDPPSLEISGGNAFRFSRLATGILVSVFTLIFLKIEATCVDPVFDLSLLKNRTFWAGNLAGFFNFIAYSAFIVLMPFFLEEEMKLSIRDAGVYMTAIPLVIFIVAPISGRLSDRFGSMELSLAGALICSVSLFLVSGLFGVGLTGKTNPAWVIVLLGSVGLAMGLFQSPNNNAIMSSVPTAKLGVASALLATVRNVGMVTGTGLTTSVFALRLQATHDFTSAMHWSCFIAGTIGVGALLATFGKERGPVRKRV